jgi:Glycosyl hydrolases family 28
MRITISIAIFLFLGFTLRAAVFPVSAYGAVGDGVTLNTGAIQEAIDACAEAGGGRVVIGRGSFLSGTLVMKSHVELHLKKGAILLGSTDVAHYPEMTTPYRFYGEEWVKQSLIFGYDLEDIRLSGRGVIDGQGAAFQATTKMKPDRYRNRPYLIRLTQCRRVTVSGLTLQNSAMWMQHYLACDDLTISGIRVFNHCNQNNDMIDIDGCHRVTMTGCVGDTDDDALTLKSTSPRANEDVTISDCILSSHCNAIKMGTESTGGFKNIRIYNCVIKPSEEKEVIYGRPEGISGISLEVVDGGVMEDILISGVVMDGPEVPLFIRLGNRARPYMKGSDVSGVGRLGGIKLENIVARNAGPTGCSITGIPGYPVKDISIRSLRLHFRGGVKASGVKDPVPELEQLYPEATMFGRLPASVFYLRHVEELSIMDVQVDFTEADGRDHLVLDDVVGFRQKGIRIGIGKAPLITVNNGSNE